MMSGVTWRLIFGYIAFLFILLLVAVSLSGCGTRKSAVDTFKANSEIKEGSKSEGSVTKETVTSESKESTEQNSNTDEKQEQRITELFYENGMLKERVTELLNSKSTNNSSSDRKSLKTSVNRIDSIFNNTLYKTVTITIKEKHKVVDADKSIVANVGGWGVVISLGVVCIGAIFLYFYLKRR